MKVAFAPDALADPTAHRYLTEIWWLTQDKLHQWVVDDLEGVLSGAWIATLGPLTSEVREVARRTRSPAPPDLIVSSSPRSGGPPWHVPARSAARYLRAPNVILVENAKIDGAFVRILLLRVGEKSIRRRFGDDAFRDLKDRWVTPLGDGEWFSVRHGGGSSTATQGSLLIDAARPLPPRAWALVDSDRTDVGADVGPTASKVQALAPVLPVVVLEKREVENYLPHDAIRRANGRATLPPADPDHGDVKDIAGPGIAASVFAADDAGTWPLHVAALRDRGGAELDRIVQALLSMM